MERAVILANKEIEPRHLNIDFQTEKALPREGLLQAGERELILKVLSEAGGNRKQAAQKLGISLRTLQYRIKEYGL